MGEAASTIERAIDLKVPEPDKFHAVISALSDDGRRDFIHEIVSALSEAQATDDLRPVQNTLDAWWMSLQFASLPNIERAFANAATAPDRESKYSSEQIAELIGK